MRRAALAAVATFGVVMLTGAAAVRVRGESDELRTRLAAERAATGWEARVRLAAAADAADAVDGAADAAIAALDELGADGYRYRLWLRGGEGPGELIAATAPGPLAEPVRAGAGGLLLELAPAAGWRPAAVAPTRFGITALLGLLAAAFVFELTRRPGDLRLQLAAERTRTEKARRLVSDEVERRQRVEQQLGREAFHDALTGLPNRAYFMNRLERALQRARQQRAYELAVVFIDLDRFKNVNDSLGHAAGDRLLTLAARRFEGCVRPQDAVARLGGDEFALLLFDIGDEDVAMEAARRVVRAFRDPFDLDGQEVFVTVSLGVAIGGHEDERPEVLLREADRAMYQAKAQGRGRAVRFDPNAGDAEVSALQLDRDLRRAIEREEFRLFFQPIVELASGRLAGFEVLVRWQHPVAGMVSPGGFIDQAEETGLIVPIDRWVLRRACEQARAWRELPGVGEFYLSVNASGSDLRQPDLLDYVAGVLSDTGLPRGVLRLEVTEGVVLANVDTTTEVIEGLRALGVPLLLDDFGTGYSSLAYLHRFQFEYLKIDRSFAGRVPNRGRDEGIVRSIVHLARDLGLQTVAEGIESDEIRQHLTALGCDFGQGYLFSEPLPLAAAEEMLLAGRSWPPAATVGADRR